jgi:uncharacterized protein YegJ (DUF2314 family)
VHSVSADGDTAFLVPSNDPNMLRARRDAECTLHEFARRLEKAPPTQSELMLKAAFHDSVNTEHLWVRVHRIVGDSLYQGVVENDPAVLRRLAYGDTVEVQRRDVDDWFAVDSDTLVAGFSIRARRRALPPDERARADSVSGYVVDSDASARGRLTWRCS